MISRIRKHSAATGRVIDKCRHAADDEQCRCAFQSILDASVAFFRRISTDEANHVAHGILSGASGNGYKAHCSYDAKSGLVTFTIILPGVHISKLEQLRALLRIQRGTHLARLDPDEEDSLLRVSAASVCTDPGKAKPMIREICDSLHSAMADFRLASIVS